MAGKVNNRSSHELWVVETDTGPAIAHVLAPGRASPPGIDADGFKARAGIPTDGHRSWVKVTSISTADVTDRDAELTRGCIACYDVGDDEFGPVKYDTTPGWGVPLA